MSIDFDGDLRELFNRDEFATDALAVNDKCFPVIFDDEFSDSLGAHSSLPMALAITTDAETYVIGVGGADPVLTIKGVAYSVREQQDDGTGITTLILERN